MNKLLSTKQAILVYAVGTTKKEGTMTDKHRLRRALAEYRRVKRVAKARYERARDANDDTEAALAMAGHLAADKAGHWLAGIIAQKAD